MQHWSKFSKFATSRKSILNINQQSVPEFADILVRPIGLVTALQSSSAKPSPKSAAFIDRRRTQSVIGQQHKFPRCTIINGYKWLGPKSISHISTTVASKWFSRQFKSSSIVGLIECPKFGSLLIGSHPPFESGPFRSWNVPLVERAHRHLRQIRNEEPHSGHQCWQFADRLWAVE